VEVAGRALELMREAASVLEPATAGVVLIASMGNAISNELICVATEASKLLHSVGLPVEIPAQVIYISIYICVYICVCV